MKTSLSDEFFSRLPHRSSNLQRNALFLTLLSKEMEARGYKRPIAVGGFAVEAYTIGQFMSLDIDLIGNRDGITTILQELDFATQDGRNWISEKFDIHIDIQGGSINIPGGDGRVTEVEAAEGCVVSMISITDITADRISAYASGHGDSEIQAIAILQAWKNHIDFKALRKICEQENAALEYRNVIREAFLQKSEERT